MNNNLCMSAIAKNSQNSHPSTEFYEAFALTSCTTTAIAAATADKKSPKSNSQQPPRQIERNVKKK